jgi:hypothetical protein
MRELPTAIDDDISGAAFERAALRFVVLTLPPYEPLLPDTEDQGSDIDDDLDDDLRASTTSLAAQAAASAAIRSNAQPTTTTTTTRGDPTRLVRSVSSDSMLTRDNYSDDQVYSAPVFCVFVCFCVLLTS